MSRVLVNNLRVRTEPSINAQSVAIFNSGNMIKSGDLLLENEGRIWLRYTDDSGNKRYVCVWDANNSEYIEVPLNIPGPRPAVLTELPDGSITGVRGIPKLSAWAHHNIRHTGCCFLAACVKGGIRDQNTCLDCYNWALSNGKIRADCYINMDKNILAQQISQRYGTPYRGDYQFQTNSIRSHFWLVCGEKEIFNSEGIGRL